MKSSISPSTTKADGVRVIDAAQTDSGASSKPRLSTSPKKSAPATAKPTKKKTTPQTKSKLNQQKNSNNSTGNDSLNDEHWALATDAAHANALIISVWPNIVRMLRDRSLDVSHLPETIDWDYLTGPLESAKFRLYARPLLDHTGLKPTVVAFTAFFRVGVKSLRSEIDLAVELALNDGNPSGSAEHENGDDDSVVPKTSRNCNNSSADILDDAKRDGERDRHHVDRSPLDKNARNDPLDECAPKDFDDNDERTHKSDIEDAICETTNESAEEGALSRENNSGGSLRPRLDHRRVRKSKEAVAALSSTSTSAPESLPASVSTSVSGSTLSPAPRQQPSKLTSTSKSSSPRPPTPVSSAPAQTPVVAKGTLHRAPDSNNETNQAGARKRKHDRPSPAVNVIILSIDGGTSFLKNEITENSSRATVAVLPYSRFSWAYADHALISTQTVLTDVALRERIVSCIGVHQSKMPRLRRDDPLVAYYGCQPGSLVINERQLGCDEIDTYFRIVS